MFDHTTLITLLGLLTIASPIVLTCILGLCTLLRWRLSEPATGKVCLSAIVVGLVAAVTVLVLMLLHGTRHEAVGVAEWVVIPGYDFSIKLIFDRLSVPFAIL